MDSEKKPEVKQDIPNVERSQESCQSDEPIKYSSQDDESDLLSKSNIYGSKDYYDYYTRLQP